MFRPASGTALVAAILLSASIPTQAQSTTQTGRLTCRVAPSIGAIVGSRRRLSCKYTKRNGDRVENYSGTITRFGLDVGFTAGGIMTWTVLARTRGHRRGRARRSLRRRERGDLPWSGRGCKSSHRRIEANDGIATGFGGGQ